MQWTVRRKLYAGFGSIVALVAVIATIAFVNMQGLIVHQKGMVFREAVMRNAYDTLALINFANSTLRGYSISIKDPKEASRIKDNLVKNWKQLDELTGKLKDKLPRLENEEQKNLVQALVADAVAYEADQVETMRLVESGDEGLQKVRSTITSASNGSANKVRNDVAELIVNINKTALEQDVVAASQAERSTWIVVLTSLFVLALASAVATLLSRRIAEPLRRAAERISQAEQEGDLTVQVAAKSNDEVGQICSAFNSFVRKLHGAISRAAGVAEQVASASEEIAAAAGEAATGAHSQQQHATQAATAMQEMTSTVHQVADHSQRASKAASHAAETAKSGGKVVETSLAGMRSIAGSTKDTAGKVAELGKSSNKIGLIVNVIDDIADQTNLLALNAAIEAARAGEQGRGFAVVADEVRKLAERTTKATKEIAQMISAIQEETKRAIDTMETVTGQVERGVEETSKAGDSLQEIIRAADTVGDMITQIATAATEQSAATGEVSSSVEQIAKITQESSSGAQQSAKACQELSALAMDLQQSVSQFRLGQGMDASEGSRFRQARRRSGWTSARTNGRVAENDSYIARQQYNTEATFHPMAGR
jgi:methyl-accepting chemotaxis protein